MAAGALDVNGIWQYGEDDPLSPYSTFMNLLAKSVSDQIAATNAKFQPVYRARITAGGSIPATGTLNISVTFPAGRFTVAPVVTSSAEGSSQVTVAASPPTASGVGITFRNNSGTAFPTAFVHLAAAPPVL